MTTQQASTSHEGDKQTSLIGISTDQCNNSQVTYNANRIHCCTFLVLFVLSLFVNPMYFGLKSKLKSSMYKLSSSFLMKAQI